VAYVALQLGVGREKLAVSSVRLGNNSNQTLSQDSEIGNVVVCRAGAMVLLVAFWFDGGLFNLATAAVFWVLLELGADRSLNKS